MDQNLNQSQSAYRPFRIALMISTLHAVCGVSMWCYSMEGELYFTTSNFKQELDIFFSAGGCKDWIFSEERPLETPIVMSDELSFVWVGEYVDGVEPIGKVLVLIGPMFSSETSMKTLEQRLQEHNLALSLRSAGKRILSHVPVVPIALMNQYICMLHFAITEKTISYKDFIFQSQLPDDPFLSAALSRRGRSTIWSMRMNTPGRPLRADYRPSSPASWRPKPFGKWRKPAVSPSFPSCIIKPMSAIFSWFTSCRTMGTSQSPYRRPATL